jgi:hypothetical protein
MTLTWRCLLKTKRFAAKSLLIAVACLLISLILGMSSLLAQDKIVVGGKMNCAFTDKKQFAIGNVDGHILALNQSTGNNVSTGLGVFMDGAAVVNYSVGDLVNGSGPQFGYVMFAKGPDTTYAKWDHTLTTSVTAEGKPETTFKGTFTFAGGTGQYKGIQGYGHFTGAFSTPTAYSVDWECEYLISK